MNIDSIITYASSVMQKESDAIISTMKHSINDNFVSAINIIMNTEGKDC